MFFWNSLGFSMIQQFDLWFLCFFQNQLERLEVHSSHTVEAWLGEFWALLVCEMSAIVQWFEHSLALRFFGIGMKTDLFQSCAHSWVFQICWHIECSTFTASSFRIWNSSAGILSPALALFVVMLLRSTWLCTPGCLALGEWSHHHGCLGHSDLFF